MYSNMRPCNLHTAIAAVISFFLAPIIHAEPTTAGASASSEPIEGGRTVPARVIPVPNDVSPELQDSIKRVPPALRAVPKNLDEWRAMAMQPSQISAALAALRKNFPTTIVSGRAGDVGIYTVMPPVVSQKNKHRVFVNLHGGSYVGGAGEAGLDEAILLAHYTGMKVISIDYRMPPDHPFPAALDDATAVWRDLVRTVKPTNIGLGGGSAGGGLALALVMKLKELKLPLPGAVLAGTPWADLTHDGDSMTTNLHIDRAPPSTGQFLLAAGRLYAGTDDPRNPFISPVFGNFSQFPPTILITGTRDLLLSDTVRVHRKLRAAGVTAELHVFEAMSHGDFIKLPDSPESREAYREIAIFLDRYLGA